MLVQLAHHESFGSNGGRRLAQADGLTGTPESSSNGRRYTPFAVPSSNRFFVGHDSTISPVTSPGSCRSGPLIASMTKRNTSVTGAPSQSHA